MITLNAIEKNISLTQSELYGQDYFNAVPRHVHTYNELSICDIEDWYNSVMYHFQSLNDIQSENFGAFYNVVRQHLRILDPAKLRMTVDWITDESDLLIWRESQAGISKLIFEDSGQITYVYNGNNGSKIRGEFDNSVDFLNLLYRFLTK